MNLGLDQLSIYIFKFVWMFHFTLSALKFIKLSLASWENLVLTKAITNV